MDTTNSAAPTGQPVRVAIIGAGFVGATTAYALLMSGLAAEIVLIDVENVKAEGEAMDLQHAVPLTHPTRVWAGTMADVAGAAITVFAAGSGQRPGETRLDLVQRNTDILRAVIPQVAATNPGGILLLATNPVDVLTHEALRLSKLPSTRVIGSGTILDTARFRYLLSEYFSIDPRSIHAYIIGEHGDSEVPVWSLANIAGMPLRQYAAAEGFDLRQTDLDAIVQQTRNAAYEIIKRKKATYYAVAAGIVRIIEAIVRDQRTVLSVSSLVENYYEMGDICFSLPAVVGRNGVERVLRLTLSPDEVAALRRSYDVLRKTIEGLKV